MMRRRVVNQQNNMPPVAHCSRTVAASRRITIGRVTAYAGGAMATPRLSTRAALVALAGVVLAGCFTGERPNFDQSPSLELTGRAEIDAVLQRLDAAPFAAFTADYDILTRLGERESTATVVQAPPGRQSVTINSVRYLVDGVTTATCDLDTDTCDARIDDSRTYGELFVGHTFHSQTPATRLRSDAEIRIGDPIGETVTIAGQPAACVRIPVTGGTVEYCALDAGPLARYDGNDLLIELTDFAPVPDETAFAS